MPLIPGKVPIFGESFGKLHTIKFDDHDLANPEAFLEWAPELYLERVLEDDVLKVVPMTWASGLARFGLLNLLGMPHFSHYNITNRIVRQLLALVHDGCLWIQDHIPIDAALIHRITGFPMKGLNPMEHVSKKYEKHITDNVRDDYHVEQNTRGFMISTISNLGVCMGTLSLACKMMRKCQVAL